MMTETTYLTKQTSPTITTIVQYQWYQVPLLTSTH